MGDERTEIALDDALEVLIDYRGKSPRKSPTGIPVISAKVVKNGTILHPIKQTIAPEYYSEWMRRGLPRPGDVVMTTEGPLGEVAQLDSVTANYALGQRIVTMRGRSGTLDSSFLKYLILSEAMQNRLASYATGTTVLGISQQALRKIKLNLPPLPEQRAIAHILGTLDDKIELNRRMNETLEGMARAIFRAWFVDFLPVKAKSAGATSFPGMPQDIFDALPAAFVDSELGPVPEGWSRRELAELFEINPSRRMKKGEIATYLAMANMPTTGHAPEKWATREFGSGMRFINGDTLIARITPCLENGKTAFVDFLPDGKIGWGSTEYIVLRPKPPLPSAFAYCLARSKEFRDFAIQNMTGTSGRQRVPATSLGAYQIPAPTEQVAAAFGTAVTSAFSKISSNQTENRTLTALRDTLLPKLISGELRVPEAMLEGGDG